MAVAREKGIDDLSPALRPVLDLELSLGNTVTRIEVDVWTSCPLAVVMSQPLHFAEAVERLAPSDDVERWENRDAHYSLEAGYVCRRTRHTLAGPLPSRSSSGSSRGS